MARPALLVLIAAVFASCTSAPTVTPTPTADPNGSSPPTPTPTPAPRIDASRILAGARTIVDGPREASSRAFRIAARAVGGQLESLGYRIRTQRFDVPAGISWGVRVPAGRSRNVIAARRGWDRRAPHVIVGAHLDTVPQAPGANDNASGVAVMLELARLAALAPTPLPVVFVAFGAEEPRTADGTGHHYGSRSYVAGLDASERAAVVGVVSLDRVGIGRDVRVCTASGAVDAFARRFLRTADRLGIHARSCANRASDHVPFADAGIPGVRLLGEDDPAYHTANDTIDVLERAQLRRIGRLAWETLERLTS